MNRIKHYLSPKSINMRLMTALCLAMSLISFGIIKTIYDSNRQSALEGVKKQLDFSAQTLTLELEANYTKLLQAAKVLNVDMALKKAIASDNHSTILANLENHRQRFDADVMMLTTGEGILIADTLHPEIKKAEFHYLSLTLAADKSQQGYVTAIAMIDNTPYQLLVSPILTPLPDGWFVLGHKIDRNFLISIKEKTASDITLLITTRAGTQQMYGTTHNIEFANHLIESDVITSSFKQLTIDGKEYVAHPLRIELTVENIVRFVFLNSYTEALVPYQIMQQSISKILAMGILFLIVVGNIIINFMTKPISNMLQFAQHMDNGDYEYTLEAEEGNDLGRIAGTLNHMAQGLIERNQIRDVLDKVVSPVVADHLIASKMALGGEEKTVTVMFTKIQDFTVLCRKHTPAMLIEILNRYLTAMSTIIESNGGVVDKYMGDAIMALFGAPNTRQGDAEFAIMSALSMQRSLQHLNEKFRAQGWPELVMGIGINTATVVSGNMGSQKRVNFTVVGDGVNNAFRAEVLARQYKLPIIVTEATQKQTSHITYQEVDRIKLPEHDQPMILYTPIGLENSITPAQQQIQTQYRGALYAYREQDWDEAEIIFNRLKKLTNEPFYDLYLKRVQKYKQSPPTGNWQGVTNL